MVSTPQGRLVGPRDGWVDAVGHDDDQLRVGAERLDDGVADVSGRHGDDACTVDRAGHAGLQVAPLGRCQVPGIRAVLEVVDRQHDRPRGARRNRAAGMVHDVDAVEAARQPGGLRPTPGGCVAGRRARRPPPRAARPGRGARPRSREGRTSVARMFGPPSWRPVSWRTRYSSDPPTSPGRHHSRLTPTTSSRAGSDVLGGSSVADGEVRQGNVGRFVAGRHRGLDDRRDGASARVSRRKNSITSVPSPSSQASTQS